MPQPLQLSQPLETRLAALDHYFKLSLYLLLLTSVLALVSTGKLDLISIVLAPRLCSSKAIAGCAATNPSSPPRAATWLVILYFVFFPLDLWWFSRGFASDAQSPAIFAVLLATVHLMLYAMMVRLFSAATTRDYLFLAMLAFTTILAAAILTVDTVFLAFFLAFLILAISTFMALEMRGSAEAAATATLEPGSQPARRLRALPCRDVRRPRRRRSRDGSGDLFYPPAIFRGLSLQLQHATHADVRIFRRRRARRNRRDQEEHAPSSCAFKSTEIRPRRPTCTGAA